MRSDCWNTKQPGATSLLSGLTLYNSLSAAAHLVQDDIGSGFPDERLGFPVPVSQPLIDGRLQFFDTMECSAADHAVGDEPEEAFDLVEPGTACRREVKVEAAPLRRFQPALDRRALVRGIVVHDEVNLLVRRHLFFQLVEKLDELLGAMPGQATANDFPVQDVEGGEQGGGSVALVIVSLALRQARP